MNKFKYFLKKHYSSEYLNYNVKTVMLQKCLYKYFYGIIKDYQYLHIN